MYHTFQVEDRFSYHVRRPRFFLPRRRTLHLRMYNQLRREIVEWLFPVSIVRIGLSLFRRIRSFHTICLRTRFEFIRRVAYLFVVRGTVNLHVSVHRSFVCEQYFRGSECRVFVFVLYNVNRMRFLLFTTFVRFLRAASVPYGVLVSHVFNHGVFHIRHQVGGTRTGSVRRPHFPCFYLHYGQRNRRYRAYYCIFCFRGGPSFYFSGAEGRSLSLASTKCSISHLWNAGSLCEVSFSLWVPFDHVSHPTYFVQRGCEFLSPIAIQWESQTVFWCPESFHAIRVYDISSFFSDETTFLPTFSFTVPTSGQEASSLVAKTEADVRAEFKATVDTLTVSSEFRAESDIYITPA